MNVCCCCVGLKTNHTPDTRLTQFDFQRNMPSRDNTWTHKEHSCRNVDQSTNMDRKGGGERGREKKGKKKDVTVHLQGRRIVLYMVMQYNRPAIYSVYVLYHTRGTFKDGDDMSVVKF